MKKILSILAAITLIGTSTTSLVSCDKVTNGENKKDSKKEPNFKPELPPENGNWKLIDKNNSINFQLLWFDGFGGKTYCG
ncbi:lipoprotein [Spiroplasma endosymbiont of Polydrusus cervinus]|uniref:lipoprotein n=1 Tax=Spiroplasma endosymbiont of Polydrusus cervinus TaxID=3066287 RepID=UPI003BAF4EA2